MKFFVQTMQITHAWSIDFFNSDSAKHMVCLFCISFILIFGLCVCKCASWRLPSVLNACAWSWNEKKKLFNSIWATPAIIFSGFLTCFYRTLEFCWCELFFFSRICIMKTVALSDGSSGGGTNTVTKKKIEENEHSHTTQQMIGTYFSWPYLSVEYIVLGGEYFFLLLLLAVSELFIRAPLFLMCFSGQWINYFYSICIYTCVCARVLDGSFGDPNEMFAHQCWHR